MSFFVQLYNFRIDIGLDDALGVYIDSQPCPLLPPAIQSLSLMGLFNYVPQKVPTKQG
jgi:hypothetical protein